VPKGYSIKIPTLLYIAAVIAIISVQPLSAEGFPKIGKTCPTGYHIDGASGYCTPFSGTKPKDIIPKNGKPVPQGIILMEKAAIVRCFRESICDR
jgi:hypothetical protein